jgi:HPt (histidine-containing phosphotransfer) domain-containing protein
MTADPMEALRIRFRVRALHEADQLEAALAGNDRATLERLAHSLAGTAGLFGYRAIGEAAAAVDGAFARGDPDASGAAPDLIEAIRRELSDHS